MFTVTVLRLFAAGAVWGRLCFLCPPLCTKGVDTFDRATETGCSSQQVDCQPGCVVTLTQRKPIPSCILTAAALSRPDSLKATHSKTRPHCLTHPNCAAPFFSPAAHLSHSCSSSAAAASAQLPPLAACLLLRVLCCQLWRLQAALSTNHPPTSLDVPVHPVLTLCCLICCVHTLEKQEACGGDDNRHTCGCAAAATRQQQRAGWQTQGML